MRLRSQPGERIDRSRHVRFFYDGKPVDAFPGDTIGSAQVGLLAAVGRAKVLVYPRPRVSIVSVGDRGRLRSDRV